MKTITRELILKMCIITFIVCLLLVCYYQFNIDEKKCIREYG